MTAYITGVASYLPGKPVASDEIESLLGQVHGVPSPVKDLILNRNGISWRHYALDPSTGAVTHSNAELTAAAIRRLAETTGVELSEVDLLACGTSSPDQLIPCHASMVHGALKLPPCEIVSTAGVCCSGMTALKYAYNSLLAGSAKRAIVTGSELASTVLRANQYRYDTGEGANGYIGFERDFLRFMLSDGAGAVLMEADQSYRTAALRLDWLDIASFANEVEPCMYWAASKENDGTFRGFRTEEGGVIEAARKGYFAVYQDVRLLRRNIVTFAVKYFKTVTEKHLLNPREIDWFLPHLSSMFFQKPLAEQMAREGLGIPMEKWFTNLSYKGNTGSASIFIILDELVKSGRIQPGQRILCGVPESARFTFACAHLTVMQQNPSARERN